MDFRAFTVKMFDRLRANQSAGPGDENGLGLHRSYSIAGGNTDFFRQGDLNGRESTYLSACRQASVVVAESEAVQKDLVVRWGLDAKKIFVFHQPSPTVLYAPVGEEILAEVRDKLALPKLFALYPAQTSPHKNHVRLLEATALLRDRQGLKLNLVCTGR